MGFLPSEDTGRFQIIAEAAQGVTYADMVHNVFNVAKVVGTEPDVAAFDAIVGGMNMGTLNQARFPVFLKPREERAGGVDSIIASLRPKMTELMGMRIFITNPPIINVGAMQTRSVYQFTLQDTDTDTLYRVAPLLEERLSRLPGLTDVTSDLQVRNPQVNLKLNRDRIAALGLTVDQVETALYNAYGTRQVSTIYAPNNQYQVILQVAPEYQSDASALSMLYVRAPAGQLVPLNAIATVGTDLGPLSVNHVGQLPSVTISFNLRPGTALGDALARVQEVAAELLPATVSTSFQGAAPMFQDSLKGPGLILVLAIVVIYVVLGIPYESFTQPLTILSGLPSAGRTAIHEADRGVSQQLCAERPVLSRQEGQHVLSKVAEFLSITDKSLPYPPSELAHPASQDPILEKELGPARLLAILSASLRIRARSWRRLQELLASFILRCPTSWHPPSIRRPARYLVRCVPVCCDAPVEPWHPDEAH